MALYPLTVLTRSAYLSYRQPSRRYQPVERIDIGHSFTHHTCLVLFLDKALPLDVSVPRASVTWLTIGCTELDAPRLELDRIPGENGDFQKDLAGT